MADSSGGAKALLSTDVVDFSRLLETHEMRALEELDHYTGLLKRLAREYHGDILSNTGDTFLVAFDRAGDAVSCAERLQEGMRKRSGVVEALPLMLRVAVHKGELAEREGNYYGETMAAVLELRGITRPGGISVTEAVAEEVGLDRRWVRGSEQSGGMAWYTLSPDQAEPGDEGSRGAGQSTAQQRAGAGSQRNEARRSESPESSEVKTRLLQEMKRRGRRLTLAEAYDSLEIRTPQERRALYNLAAAGFLARGTQGRGTQGRGTPRSGGTARGRPTAPPRGANARDDNWYPRVQRSGGASGGSGGSGRGERSRRVAETDDMLVPSRRGFGDEREDREIESAWDQVLSRRFAGGRAPTRDPVVKSYKEQTERSLEQVRGGFRGHLISYLGVNGMLITVGALTGALPWLAIPALAWGIGLTTHWAQLRQRRREVRELQKMRNPTRDKLRVFRRLTRARNSFQSHLISNGATSIFLFALNMIVSPGFPWFVFPVGGMAIGVLSHYPAFRAKERKLTGELQQIAAQTPAPRASAINPDASPVEQAEELQEGILGQMEALGQRSDVLGEDFEKLLSNYVEQVRALTERGQELDDVIDAHSVHQVERELAQLRRKREATEDGRLQRQYDETIRELEKQRKSIEALISEREMIALRINSGLNMMKNVRIEMVRLKTASDTRDVAAGIEAQSKELVSQLEDLRAAYEELDEHPR